MSLLDWMDVTEEEVNRREYSLVREKQNTGRVRNKTCGNCMYNRHQHCTKFGMSLDDKDLKKDKSRASCWGIFKCIETPLIDL